MNRLFLMLIISVMSCAVSIAENMKEPAQPHIVVNTMSAGMTGSIALSADGKILFSADEYSGTVKSWDVESGRLLRTWGGFDFIRQITLSGNGMLLCVRTLQRTAILDAGSGAVIRDFPKQYSGSAFSPDGTMLALCSTYSGRSMKIVNPVTGEFIREFGVDAYSYGAAFRPDGKEIAVCGGDNRIHLFDPALESAVRIFDGPADKCNVITYSPDGENLAIASPDKKITVREAASGKIRYSIDDFPAEATVVVYNPDGKSIAVGADKILRIVKAKNGKKIFECVSANNQLKVGRTAVFSADGKKIFTASFGISAWDLDEEKELGPIGGSYSAFCRGVAFSPDRKRLALAGDSSFRVIDMETGGIDFGSMDYLYPSIFLFTYSNDGSRLFAGSADVIRMYNCATGEVMHEIRKKTTIACAAVQPDGKNIVYAEGKTVTFCEPSPEGARVVNEMKDPVISIAYSPDGKTVVLRDSKGVIHFINALTKRELFNVKYPGSGYYPTLLFSPDGRILAVGGSREFCVIQLASRRIIRTLKVIPSNLNAIAFSPDGKALAVGGNDINIYIWDTVSWKERKQLKGHSSRIQTLAFSPDGKLIISGGADKLFRFWNYPEGDESGGLILSTGTYSTVTFTKVNGKETKTKSESGVTKSFLVITPSGLYDGTKDELARLHWVVGNEVIPLSEFGESFRTTGLLGQILSAHVSKPPIDAAKRLFGKIRLINGNDVVVSYSGTRSIAQVKERFTVFCDNGEQASLEAVFPMMTSMKCRVVNPAQRKLIRPGMPVFR